MPAVIKIKRTSTGGAPGALKSGELAYSYLAGTISNNGDRLFFGQGDDGSGNATSISVIGGKYFTDKLDHTPGTLTTSSAVLVDSDGKIDIFNVDNIRLDGNTITTTAGGNLIITAGGTDKISFYSAYTFPRTAGNAGEALVYDGAGNLTWAGVTTANTASNLAGGAAGQIPIQSAAGVTTFIAAGTSGQILQAGTNTATFVSTSTLYVGRALVADSATTATSAATAYALASTGTTYVYRATLADSATTATSAATAYALANTGTTYVYRATLADSATTATSAATAYALANTGTTYVGRAVLADSATTATSAATAYALANTATTFVGRATTSSFAAIAYALADTGTTYVYRATLADTATTATSAATAYALASTGTTYVYRATLADSATTATSAATAYALANTGTTYVYRATLADSATTATSAATAYALANTGTTYVYRATLSDSLGTGGAQSINTNALTLSNYADNTGILYFSNGAGLIASNSASFAWDNSAGVLRVKTTTSATSTTTGALVVTGGVGIGGDLYVHRSVDILSPLASTSTVENNALYVAGGVGINGSLYVKGPAVFQNDVVFSGTTTYVYSTQTIYTDNILNLHTPSGGVEGAWTVNDGKDIGFVFHNYIDGADNDSFLGFANDTKYLEWYVKGSENTSSVFTGTVYGIFKTGGIVLVNTTASNSTTTGALTVAGGVGIGGNLNVGGSIIASSITGSITTATNLSGGTAGQVPYQTGAGTTNFFGPGTAGQILVSGGTSGPSYTNTGSIYVGNAVNAEKLLTARTITLAGDLGGSASFDGSTNITITATIQADSVALGTDTTGIYVASGAVSGFGLSGSASSEGATFTVTSNATSTNVSSTIVFRDGSGNIRVSAVTGDLVGTASTATNLTGGAAGSLPYQTGAGVTTFLSIGAGGTFLQVSTVTSLPIWTDTIDGGTY